MQNLAGHKQSTEIITKELIRCGIEIVPSEEPIGEPQAMVTGKLGQFTFERAWYYYCISGAVPLPVAEELYTNPIGKTDIRVAGHCGCPPPSDWADIIASDGRQVLTRKDEIEFRAYYKTQEQWAEVEAKFLFADDPSSAGTGFVRSYHIDSELGLYIFVQALKQHRLV